MDYKIWVVDRFAEIDDDLCAKVHHLTKPISQTYPEQPQWLEEKFFPNLNNGSRKMVLASDITGRLAGVALLKDTAEEKKICCLFVRKDCRGNGISGKLMQKSLEVLGTDKPLLTISDKNYPQLKRLLELHQFKFSYQKKNAYKKNNTEYYFNNAATDILKEKILTPLLAGAFSKHR